MANIFCRLLQFLMEHAPSESVRHHLQKAYDAHCGDDGGTVHTNDGGSGQPGPPNQ